MLVSNSETLEGGASALRFDRDGQVARRLPDPLRHDPELLRRRHALGHLALLRGGRGRPRLGVRPERRASARSPHPAMGVFKHEAAAVDPRGRRVYLTEDLIDGGLYRYTPERWPDLSAGRARDRPRGPGGRVEWVEVPDPLARRERTRRQVRGQHALQARRGHLARRRHALRVDHRRPPRARLRHPPRAIEVIYDGLASAQRAAAARRPADGLARRRGVRLRGPRHRGDRHGRDRPRPDACRSSSRSPGRSTRARSSPA